MAIEVHSYASDARVLTPYYCGGVMYVSLVLDLFEEMILERRTDSYAVETNHWEMIGDDYYWCYSGHGTSCREGNSIYLMFANVSKKHMGECILEALESWLGIVHVDKTIPYISSPRRWEHGSRRVINQWTRVRLKRISKISKSEHKLKKRPEPFESSKDLAFGKGVSMYLSIIWLSKGVPNISKSTFKQRNRSVFVL
ncbi:hypothetical protein ISN44_As13g009430 [Arabidopsis suecica]|uniref:Uncharacterized protein n=1 Tax=Arabidopsis suecica TaxID=45249 RepID=A0A8T1XQ64_ARASU|nr:hypothetical protein ISN44_As13g009430 [Arabidopsis suecica]